MSDFYLSGYLKEKVYFYKIQTLEQLQAIIEREMCAIFHRISERVMKNFTNQLEQCIENFGHHSYNVIFTSY